MGRFAIAIAIVALSVVGTGACTQGPTATATARPSAVPAKSLPAADRTPDPTVAPCPHGSPLPNGQGVVIDYVDFLQIAGRTYLSSHMAEQQPPPRRQGQVVGRVRCNLQDLPGNEAGPRHVDGTAAFLPVGTVLTEAVGVPRSCEILARVGTQLRSYLLQVQLGQHSVVSTCWRRYSRS